MTILKNRKSILFIFGFSCLFLFVKYFGPQLIERLFLANGFSLLNQWTHSQAQESLDFYLGRMDDLYFGPTSMLFAGIAFLIFCFLYFKKQTGLYFGLAVFIYFVLTRPEVLFYPPYGDTYTGAFSDATWLVRHSFDYWGFWHQPSFAFGGPKIYPTTIFPSLLAGLIWVSPSANLFNFSAHTIVLLMASSVIVIFRRILLNFFDERKSLLISLSLLFFPLFQSMAELINMEMACLYFAILSIYFVLNQKFQWASLMAVISLLMKPPGGIACLVILVAGILLFIQTQDKKYVKAIIWGIVAVGFMFFMGWLRIVMMQEQNQTNHLDFMAGWNVMKVKKYFYLYGILSGLFIFQSLIELWKLKGDLKLFLSQNFNIITVFLMVSFWFLSYLQFSALLCRYELLLLPFYIVFVFYMLFPIVKHSRIFESAIVLSLIVLLLGSYGLWYDQKGYFPDANVFERSLEYRNDLKMNMRLAKELEENFSTYAVVAPVVIAQFLNFNEVRDSAKPLNVFMYGAKSPQEAIKDFPGLGSLDIYKTIFIALGIETVRTGTNYPIAPEDKIIKKIQAGDKHTYLFMGGIGIQKKWLIYQLRQRNLI